MILSLILKAESIFFSIIIPVFNREKTVYRAIESVLNQSYGNWEMLFVDDCSSDNSYKLLQTLEDPRIRVFQTKSNVGPAAARNLGIANAKGNVVSFLDSDDFYELNFLEKTLETILTAPDSVGFFWTGLMVTYQNEVKKELWNPTIRVSTYLTFLHELRIGTNSGLSVRKSVFDKCGLFNEKLLAAEDTEWLLRISQYFDFKVIEDYLINISKVNKDRLSLNYKKIALAYNTFIIQHQSTIKTKKTLQRKFYYKLMWLNYHLGEKKLARSYFIKLLRVEPGNVKGLSVFLIFEVLGTKKGSEFHIKYAR